MNLESIRMLIQANPRTSDGYLQKVRDAVGRYAQQCRDEGMRWDLLEREVGISSTSMRIWMQALQGARFQQVVVVDDSPVEVLEQGFAITSPSGFTLTGCSLEQAALLLQRLQ